jgi:hypothetical protein
MLIHCRSISQFKGHYFALISPIIGLKSGQFLRLQVDSDLIKGLLNIQLSKDLSFAKPS